MLKLLAVVAVLLTVAVAIVIYWHIEQRALRKKEKEVFSEEVSKPSGKDDVSPPVDLRAEQFRAIPFSLEEFRQCSNTTIIGFPRKSKDNWVYGLFDGIHKKKVRLRVVYGDNEKIRTRALSDRRLWHIAA